MLLFVANATKMHGRKRIRKSHRDPTVNYGRKALDPLPQRFAPRPIDGKLADRKSGAAKQRADWARRGNERPASEDDGAKRSASGERARTGSAQGGKGRRSGGNGESKRRRKGNTKHATRRKGGWRARRRAREGEGPQRGNAAAKGGAGRRTRGEASEGSKTDSRFRCAPPRALRMSRSRRRNPSAPLSHAWMRSVLSPSALAKIHRKTYNTASASLDLEPGRLDLPHRRRGGSNPASASRGPCAAPTQKPENL